MGCWCDTNKGGGAIEVVGATPTTAGGVIEVVGVTPTTAGGAIEVVGVTPTRARGAIEVVGVTPTTAGEYTHLTTIDRRSLFSVGQGLNPALRKKGKGIK